MKLDDGSVFLDSSKSIEHTLYLKQIPEFDFRIIWLARDPRAQVFSAMKYNPWTAEQAAQEWKAEMQRNEQLLTAMKANYTVLSYEQLCREPELEMKRLLEFAGLDPAAFSLNFREQTQHIMGNASMRLGKDATIKERTEWKTGLSAEQIAVIERVTKDFRSYYS